MLKENKPTSSHRAFARAAAKSSVLVGTGNDSNDAPAVTFTAQV